MRLRVLVGHNEYRTRSGEAAVVKQEVELLNRAGHYVVEYYLSNDELKLRNLPRAVLESFWNGRAYAKVRQLVRRNGVQVCHFHNTFPLMSPSVYYAARAEGAAVVQTLHNYRLVCPSAVMYRKGGPCSLCVGKTVAWPGIWRGCYRGSRLVTAWVAWVVGIHRKLGTYERAVDIYVALSEESKKWYSAGGLPAERIVVRPNCLAGPMMPGNGEGGYVVYGGRLSPEKGVGTLVRAWSEYRPLLSLKIVGDGPLREFVKGAAQRTVGIEYVGWLSREALRELVGGAALMVVPSEWYEPCPMSVLEAFSVGTPVLASAIGGLKEMISHGRTGLLFQPGNAKELAEWVDWGARNRDRLRAMRVAAVREAERRCSADSALGSLLKVYELAVARVVGRSSTEGFADDPRSAGRAEDRR